MPKRKYNGRKTTPLLVRLMRRIVVDPVSGCWLWQGMLNDKGYGTIRDGNKMITVHQASYRIHKGIIPEGMELDHICHRPQECPGGKDCIHRRCCNPDHVEPSLHRENCSSKRAVNVFARKTHCVKGHPFSPENTHILYGKYRACKACGREAARRWREKNLTRRNG